MKSCIDACVACAIECQHCATECLKESDIKSLSLCISLVRECAVACMATAQLMAMGGENATLLCQPCAAICNACAAECERNGELEHCRRCAEACRRCAEECREMTEAMVS
jgi:hypothetical protein